jgi:enoyl-CoA hydratase
MVKDVVCEKRDSAMWIRLNRPAELNALTHAMFDGCIAALDGAAGDPEVMVVVVTGTGRAFCAGADLKFLLEIPPQQRDDAINVYLHRASDLMTRFETFPKPVIAAVNGIATAGGMELVLSCDLVIAAKSASLGDGHANYGLLPGAGASVRLPRKIGPTRAKYLFFTGDLLPPVECLAMGLVNQVIDDAELEAAVDRLVKKIAAKSPIGLRRMKQLVDDGLNQPRDTAMRLELAVSALHTSSFDRNEGIAAFNEKRKPQFQGR